jgi:hypothetical protein
LKTSAGKKGVDGNKFSRRLELVREVRLAPERSSRRFRIGLADNLFSTPAEMKLQSGSLESDSPTESELPVQAEGQPGFSQTELWIGLTAVAGLTLGYLIGKSRK